MKNTDKLSIGIYKAATTKQANPIMDLLKRMGTSAVHAGAGAVVGAGAGVKGLLNMPKIGIPGGFKMMAKDVARFKADPAVGRSGLAGVYGGLGAVGAATGVGASKAVKGVYGMGENKGMAKGREQGLAEMLAQVQGQKQERGYLGNLLDAIMNKQQGV